jgi:hypothetical protein
MDPMTIGLLAGAGTGLLKSELIDRPEAARQRKLQAEVARYSPWTGMQANTNLKGANPLGSVMQGGMAGAQVGQSMKGMMGQQAAQPMEQGGQASLTGNQSVDPMLQPGYQPKTFEEYMALQKMKGQSPWMGMESDQPTQVNASY